MRKDYFTLDLIKAAKKDTNVPFLINYSLVIYSIARFFA